MKYLAFLGLPTLLLSLGLAPTPAVPSAAPAPAAGTFQVDSGHSSVVFSVKHAGASWFYGTFDEVKGAFTMNADDPAASKVTIEIGAASVNTRSADRDGHLASPDFFNSAEFPTITFESTSVARSDKGLELTGDLTLLGKTVEIKASAEHIGDGEFRGARSGWETRFEIQRSEFGMNYGLEAGVLGDTVRVIVALEGVQN